MTMKDLSYTQKDSLVQVNKHISPNIGANVNFSA